MAQKAKKAKLAHEKRTNGQEVDLGQSFIAAEFVEFVDFQGKPSAVVVMDANGTKGVIDRGFITVNAQGAPIMRRFANPITYDQVAQQKAAERYLAFAKN